jgi:hypothetical protein
LFNGFGGGMSSRLLYLTIRPRFLVAFAVIPIRLPSRDSADVAASFGVNHPDHFTTVFAERDPTSLAVITTLILGGQHIAPEDFRRLTKANTVFALVGRVFALVPLELRAM